MQSVQGILDSRRHDPCKRWQKTEQNQFLYMRGYRPLPARLNKHLVCEKISRADLVPASGYTRIPECVVISLYSEKQGIQLFCFFQPDPIAQDEYWIPLSTSPLVRHI